MAYRNNRNFDRNNYGGSISRNVDPWDTSNDNWSMRGGGGGGNNNMGGGGGGGNNGGGNFNPNSSTELANHLLQLLRNGGGGGGNQAPPSLMDLPQGDMRGYGGGGYGRNNGGGDFDRFEDRRMGGGGGGGHHNNNNNRQNNSHNAPIHNNQANNNRNRRMGGGGGGNVGGGNNGGHVGGPMGRHQGQGPHQNKGGNTQGNNLNRNSGGIRKPNSLDRSKKVLAKNSQNKANNAGNKPAAAAKTKAIVADQSYDEHDENADTANAGDSVYADVPADMFYCHLCKKHMWDCTSFENHVKGRTHQMMKEGVEESYRLKANMIRQEAKIDEQLKSIEVDRLKRMGKQMKNANAHREYCQMCDLHFYGHLSTHRKSEGHLALKKFLHPKCTECNDEFQNRIEFDAHLLSREHMLKCAAKASRVDPRKKNQLVILTEVDEAKDVREEKVKAAKVAAEGATAGEEGAAVVATDGTTATEEGAAKEGATNENGEAMDTTVEGGGGATEGGEKAATAAEAKPEVENPDAIFDYVEGVTEIGTEIEARIPTYKSSRAIAASMIAKLECFECKLCNRFFDTEKTAEVHSRTVSHHKQFAKFLTEKSNEAKIALKRANASIEHEKRKRAREEKATEAAASGEGEVKAEVNGEAKEGETPAVQGTTNGEAAKDEAELPEKRAKLEMYDPAEATEDTDKDVSMTEVPATPTTVAVTNPVAVTPAPATPVAAKPVAPAPPVISTPAAQATPAKTTTPATAVKPVQGTPATPAATPSPAAGTPKSAGSNAGTPGRGGRGGNRGNGRGRGRGRRF